MGVAPPPPLLAESPLLSRYGRGGADAVCSGYRHRLFLLHRRLRRQRTNLGGREGGLVPSPPPLFVAKLLFALLFAVVAVLGEGGAEPPPRLLVAADASPPHR